MVGTYSHPKQGLMGQLSTGDGAAVGAAVAAKSQREGNKATSAGRRVGKVTSAAWILPRSAVGDRRPLWRHHRIQSHQTNSESHALHERGPALCADYVIL
jgi:hypothetical protein